MKSIIKTILILSLIALLVACDSTTPSATNDTATSSSEPTIEAETVLEPVDTPDTPLDPSLGIVERVELPLNFDGEIFIVEATEAWQSRDGTITNGSVIVEPENRLPLDGDIADILNPLASESFAAFDVTEGNGQTVYVSLDGDDIDIFVVYNETDILVFNVSTIDNANFINFQEEVSQILTTIRPQAD